MGKYDYLLADEGADSDSEDINSMADRLIQEYHDVRRDDGHDDRDEQPVKLTSKYDYLLEDENEDINTVADRLIQEYYDALTGHIPINDLPPGGFLGPDYGPAAIGRQNASREAGAWRGDAPRSTPRAQEHYLNGLHDDNHHVDRLIVQPLHLLHTWDHGSSFTAEFEGEWKMIGRTLMVGGQSEAEVKRKLRRHEVDTQKKCCREIVHGLKHTMRATGGVNLWKTAHRKERDNAMRHAFRQCPTAIANAVFKEHARVIDFEAMFENPQKAEDLTAWARFTEAKLIRLCSVAFTFVVAWEGQGPISGMTIMYDTLRNCHLNESIADIRGGTGGVGTIPVFASA